MTGRIRRFALLVMTLFVSACGSEPGNRKETFPVIGEVYVDGVPGENIEIRCHDQKGLDTSNPTSSGTYTDKDGKFKISTYKSGDGVPEGDYVMTFFWGQMNLISMSYGGPDQLNDRYKDPATSKFKVTVKKGQPADLGRIELTTK